MQNVRRFISAATGSAAPSQPEPPRQATPPPNPAFNQPGPSWPPTSPTTYQPAPSTGSPGSTAPLSFRKDKATPADASPSGPAGLPLVSDSASPFTSPLRNGRSIPPSSPPKTRSSAVNSPLLSSSPRVLPATNGIARKPTPSSEPEWRPTSQAMSTRDELLTSLLASEAMVESRDYPILGPEEIEDLKKEQQVLTSRLEAMNKKLGLETKIRDAALSLARVNATHKKVSKQTDEQIEGANRRVETAQKEVWRISGRLNDVYKKLLEHRAGVLSLSVRSMEKKLTPDGDDSGYTSNRSTILSPTSSTSFSTTSSKTRFDGAHLFAGHADAIVPKRVLSADAAATEIAALEEKLKAATQSLSNASKKQAQLTRELSLLQLEKDAVETKLGMELQNATEAITALEEELPRLEGLDAEVQDLLEEKSEWQKDRDLLEERERQMKELEARLADQESQSAKNVGAESLLAEARERSQQELDRKEAELQNLRREMNSKEAEWEKERGAMEDERMDDLARLQDEMDRLREQDRTELQKANQDLDGGLDALRTLVKQHGIVLFSRDSSLQGLLGSIGTHLDTVHQKLENYAKTQAEWEGARRKLEDDVRFGLDKRESLTKEMEEVRRSRDSAEREVRFMKEHAEVALLRSPASPMSIPLPLTMDSSGEVSKIVAVLQPIFNILPSPEGRAAKFQRNIRARSPMRGSPEVMPTSPTSLSELDVRSLKALYDNKLVPGSPVSPRATTFTIEAFAARVQALIQDDKALIERLVRFAQAHDLLRKNAERAQKLAQESSSALETYQKQVKTLEERNSSLTVKLASLQDEIHQLQEAVERLTTEKQDIEMQAAEQAETCRQLTEANNTLSAKTLTLAQEAAAAPEMIRKQLETQLAECKAALEESQREVEAMRLSEQSQSMALLEELNNVQNENGILRQQLRAAGKK
ncbi:hypothetical protein BDN72DRAFT_823239 [Pluteus cervinus]|uniref:Uncharacterized protein n=1 Tax=Pluteus cervinus TaxID=181527 RepID=A0ACD3ALI2_9AGAR|nr:hypothetical protein BDN72DRAFT_823239 [Pluteus cervinus]